MWHTELLPIVAFGHDMDQVIVAVNRKQRILYNNKVLLNGLRRGGIAKREKFCVNDPLHLNRQTKKELLKRILKRLF